MPITNAHITVKNLIESGFTEDQAKVVTSAIIENNIDITDIKIDIALMKADIATIKGTMVTKTELKLN